jgi:hypothetical protein
MLESSRKGRAFAGMSSQAPQRKGRPGRNLVRWSSGLADFVNDQMQQQQQEGMNAMCP